MIDVMWVLVSAGLVFAMQAGFLCLEAGMTRTKNAINVAMKNLTDFGVAVLLFWAFGFALMFGATRGGWIGWSNFLAPVGQGGAWLSTFFLFQVVFCGTAVTIISGAVAERIRFASYIIVAAIVSGLVYPLFGHWVWGGAFEGPPGWLASLGFVDFAGSTVVHSVGGWAALAVLLVIGPREGRFPRAGAPARIPGSNLPVAMLGVLLLWIGWIGFNGGSTFAMNDQVPRVIANTMLAAGAGLVTALSIGWAWSRYPDPSLVMNGALAGLVAITANAFAIDAKSAVIIGGIGAVFMLGAQNLMERLRIDDVVGAVPVHMAAGVWGTIAVAVFGKPEILATGLDRVSQLQVQLLGIGVCCLLAFGVTYILLRTINRAFPLRITRDEERIGLNVAEHRATTEILDLVTDMEIQANTQDLGLRVREEPFTEVGQIAKQYNRVMQSLQEADQKTKMLNESLEQRVEERTAVAEERARELARSNADLEQFAYVATHDLQEPLRKVQTFGGLLANKFSDSLDEQARNYLDRMRDAAGRMRALINDLLTLSRVSSPNQSRVPVDLTRITQEVSSDLEALVAETRGRVDVGDLPTIDADPTQMRQLQQNLISNALKFHRPEEPPLVKVRGRLLGGHEGHVSGKSQSEGICEITVEDNGIGFDESYLDRIFTVFERLHGRDTYDGTGIGLATCRKIVERHGGSITATSTPGKGSTFIVTLPAGQPEGEKRNE